MPIGTVFVNPVTIANKLIFTAWNTSTVSIVSLDAYAATIQI